ncbi:MAG: glycosyltransferase, partial [Rhodospirillales bacterium]|nr:glycosyltransferase [Rhodospirillales bacterium]
PLEAMASGVPVIASDTGFFPAFIGANEAGILVDQLDAGQILSSARSMIDSPAEMDRMSSRARQRAINRFGLESEVDGIHRVYEELWT